MPKRPSDVFVDHSEHAIIFMFTPVSAKNKQIPKRLHSLHALTAKYFEEMHFQDIKGQ